jgi:hypothetical protein
MTSIELAKKVHFTNDGRSAASRLLNGSVRSSKLQLPYFRPVAIRDSGPKNAHTDTSCEATRPKKVGIGCECL